MNCACAQPTSCARRALYSSCGLTAKALLIPTLTRDERTHTHESRRDWRPPTQQAINLQKGRITTHSLNGFKSKELKHKREKEIVTHMHKHKMRRKRKSMALTCQSCGLYLQHLIIISIILALLTRISNCQTTATTQQERTGSLKIDPTSGAYSGLTFTFDPARLEGRQLEQRLHFEHWLSVMRESSSLLYESLAGRAHLSEVRVLIPYKWRSLEWPVAHKSSTVMTNRRLRYVDSDVIVGPEGKSHTNCLIVFAECFLRNIFLSLSHFGELISSFKQHARRASSFYFYLRGITTTTTRAARVSLAMTHTHALDWIARVIAQQHAHTHTEFTCNKFAQVMQEKSFLSLSCCLSTGRKEKRK